MTTDKESCRIIIELLVAHGVKDVVLSPGSRNTPLIVAARRNANLRTHVIIDERSAAFFGLGIAIQTRKPVALICTSGSAPLNYAPALAEAYYRHIPLIAITADRPAEWIDQDDSQTIRQVGALANIVKGSFDINGDMKGKVYRNFTVRTVNDALILAEEAPRGPVHINVRLDEPLGGLIDTTRTVARKIDLITPEHPNLSTAQFSQLAEQLRGKKTMVIAGFGEGSRRLDDAIDEFVRKSGAVVMHEAQSNVHPAISLGHIDATLITLTDEEIAALRPERIITFGGSIVSRIIKKFLRDGSGIRHWHVAQSERSIDCFMSLTKRIECDPADFFNGLSQALQLQAPDISYLKAWRLKASEGKVHIKDYFHDAPWSDFYAIGRLMLITPRKWNLHFSNGTAIRYAQLFDYTAFNNIECNRGVSGIDGCTSTAIGAHLYNDEVTLLVSGDMSAQYDIGALGINEITPRFKMAVLNNAGGGIFRFIKSTSDLEECEECFAAKVNLPLRALAEAYGFAYFEAVDKTSLDKAFGLFAAESDRPAILNIITPPQESADILRNYFKRIAK